MSKKIHQATDKSYKFTYRRLNIKFHRYFYKKGNKIVFIDTEIPETGQKRDATVIVDDKYIQHSEFMSKPLSEDKIIILHDYHHDLVYDRNNKGLPVVTTVISIANPNHGKRIARIDTNRLFEPCIIFTKNMDGQKILNNLIHKIDCNEELSDDDAIDLLVLPDMDIEMDIRELMKLICKLINKANIPDATFKDDIILCEIRFFVGKELNEMIDLLKTATMDPKVAEIIEESGPGFEIYYLDGKAEGYTNGYANGVEDSQLEIISNALSNGFDDETISDLTGLSIEKIKEIQRKL